jgi:hypothetical protein
MPEVSVLPWLLHPQAHLRDVSESPFRQQKQVSSSPWGRKKAKNEWAEEQNRSTIKRLVIPALKPRLFIMKISYMSQFLFSALN